MSRPTGPRGSQGQSASRRLAAGLLGCALSATGAAAQAPFSLVDLSTAGVQANSDATGPRLSYGGNHVVFASTASNLVPGIINVGHVFLRDRVTGITTIESVSTTNKKGNAVSARPDISDDGRWIVFESHASNLVAPDVNGMDDVFLRDRLLGTTELISKSLGGAPGNGDSRWASVSDDGRFVAFQSAASDLVAGDGNSSIDVFVRDRQAGTTELVTVTPGGLPGANGGLEPRLTPDGRFVAFLSASFDLVGLAGGAHLQVMLRDRLTGSTTLESVNELGEAAASECRGIGLSDDAQVILFASGGENLVYDDDNLFKDVFVRDRAHSVTERISVAPGGQQVYANSGALSDSLAISGDGMRVAFESLADFFVPGNDGSLDVYLWDRATQVLSCATTTAGGAPSDGWSFAPCLSSDGLVLALQSGAGNLAPPDANGPFHDVLVTPWEPRPWAWTGYALAGAAGFPILHGEGSLEAGAPCQITLEKAAPSAPMLLFVSLTPTPVPFKGGTLVAFPALVALPLVTSAAGGLALPFAWPAGVPSGTTLVFQAAIADAGAPKGVALANALAGTTP